MKKRVRTIFKCVIFLLLTGMVLTAAFRLTERKESTEMNGELLANGSTVDVLFAGSSHVVDGIDPAVLWSDYGITSYNIAGHGSNIPTTYWALVNALEYCSPKVVLVDTFMLERNYQYLDVLDETYDDAARESAVSQFHTIIDAYPLSMHKIEAIRDLIFKPSVRAELYCSFIRYHGRWSSLTEKDYEEFDGRNCSDDILGSNELFTTDPDCYTVAELPEDDILTENTLSKDYLRRIIELCKSKGIPVILIHVPFPEDEDYQRASNSGSTIAAEYGIPFINMNRVSGLINASTDLADQSHLNALGSYKVSKYLGEILSENGIADHRGEAGYELYDEASSKLDREVLSASSNPQDLYSLLSTLQLPETSSIVFVKPGSAILRNEEIMNELSELSGSDAVRSASENGAPYFLVRDNVLGLIAESADGNALENIETSFGRLSYYAPDPAYDLVTIGESEENRLDFDSHADSDVQVIVYDNASGQEIAHLCYKDDIRYDE